MKIFCRHCWEKVDPILETIDCHISAFCPKCKNWIKYLNTVESKTILKILLNAKITKT